MKISYERLLKYIDDEIKAGNKELEILRELLISGYFKLSEV